MASAAGVPSVSRPATRASIPAAMGFRERGWPMTPVEATITSSAGTACVLLHQGAHAPGDVQPVGVAGVGVAAVADDGAGLSVFQVFLGHQDGRALHQVLGIHPGGGAVRVADDEGQIPFGLIVPDAAVDAAGPGSPWRRRRRRKLLGSCSTLQSCGGVEPQDEIHALDSGAGGALAPGCQSGRCTAPALHFP